MEVSTVNSSSGKAVQSLLPDDNLQSIHQQQKSKVIISSRSLNNNSSSTNSLTSTNNVFVSNMSSSKNSNGNNNINNNDNDNNNIIPYDIPYEQIDSGVSNLAANQTEASSITETSGANLTEIENLLGQLVLRIHSELNSRQQLPQSTATLYSSSTGASGSHSTALGKTKQQQDLLTEKAATNVETLSDQRISPSLSPDDEATCDLVIDSEVPSIESTDATTINTTTTTTTTAPATLQEEQLAPFSSVSSGERGKQVEHAAKGFESTTQTEQSDDASIDKEVRMETDSSSSDASKTEETDDTTKSSSTTDDVKLGQNLEGHQTAGSSASLTRERNKVTSPENELEEKEKKDMVTLRNLEITPPPALMDIDEAPDHDADKDDDGATSGAKDKSSKASSKSELAATSKRRSSKRTRTTTPESASDLNDSSESASRSKRQRRQTQRYQVGGGEYSPAPSPSVSISSSSKSRTSTSKTTSRSTRERKKASTSSPNPSTATSSAGPPPTPQVTPPTLMPHSNIPQDVIFYEKNDYLAIRNEEDSFYLCQLTENVKVNRPLIRVRWLDTKDNKTYFLTNLFDQVPQLSILMPVTLEKLKSDTKGDQLFMLSEQDRDNVMERLKRSLNAVSVLNSSQQSSSDE